MRSTDDNERYRSEESTTAERIVTAACALIAQRGASETSVREVARSAGVSAPLVIHHFGSKAGLVEACDRRVTDALDQVLAPIRSGDPLDSVEVGWVELLGSTPYLDYITRSLLDGGELGARLFDELYKLSLETGRAMEAIGLARPSEDPEMRALLLFALDMGMLMMSDHAARVLGASLDSPEMGGRWVRAVVDLLSNGLLLSPDETEEDPQ